MTTVPTTKSTTAQSRIKETASAYSGATEVASRLNADLERVVMTALTEDLGVNVGREAGGSLTALLLNQDVTSSSIVPADATARASMLAKSAGVIAGTKAVETVFQLIDPSIKIAFTVHDGAEIANPPQELATIEGNARAILLAERTALNIIQRMSGIATVARNFSARAQSKGIAIIDTRKTTPGLRTLEKYAVQLGGAANHRYGLYDAILIKDNHIAVAGGITEAIKRARQAQPSMPVEVEVSNFFQLEEALQQRAEKIMLDNMSPAQVKEAVAIVAGGALIEVSGGVNADNLDGYLIEGVNAISIGALTHSVRSMDISLNIEV